MNNNKSNDLCHTINTTDDNGNSMVIKIRLNDECKNGHQDFAITANIYEKGKPHIDKYFIMGGCCHDEILASNPELKLFVQLHLCDYKGIPMHAVANGFYHLRNGFNDTKPDNEGFKSEYCDYYRVTNEQFDALNACENELQYALQLQNLGILAQWELQANKAISKLETMTGKKFVVDSIRTQFVAPTPEQLQEEQEKQATGYYTPEAKQKREQEKQSAIHNKLLQERDAKINDIKTEYDTLEQVLLIGGKKALDNCIYYNHTKTLAFNWKSYDNISNDLIDKIKEQIKLPEGVTIENKQ